MAFAFLMGTTEAKIPELKDVTESFKGWYPPESLSQTQSLLFIALQTSSFHFVS